MHYRVYKWSTAAYVVYTAAMFAAALVGSVEDSCSRVGMCATRRRVTRAGDDRPCGRPWHCVVGGVFCDVLATAVHDVEVEGWPSRSSRGSQCRGRGRCRCRRTSCRCLLSACAGDRRAGRRRLLCVLLPGVCVQGELDDVGPDVQRRGAPRPPAMCAAHPWVRWSRTSCSCSRGTTTLPTAGRSAWWRSGRATQQLRCPAARRVAPHDALQTPLITDAA